MATFCGISHIVHSSADCEHCCVSLDSFHWFNVHDMPISLFLAFRSQLDLIRWCQNRRTGQKRIIYDIENDCRISLRTLTIECVLLLNNIFMAL